MLSRSLPRRRAMKLTRDAVAALVLPAGKGDVVHWDSTLARFRLSPSWAARNET